MTDKEKYLLACYAAIIQHKRKGSSSVILGIHSDNPTTVEWDEVLKWLSSEFEKEQKNEK